MPDSIYSHLKDKLEDYSHPDHFEAIGVIDYVGDGIAHVVGLEGAMYGEMIYFENGSYGMVQSLKNDGIGVIIFGDYIDLSEGDIVRRSFDIMKVGVGEELLGRVVDPIGNPIDGGPAIQLDESRPVEHSAPGIMDRKKIDRPLQTGIKAIDALVPIGRGQRELIIGDRKTGKTTLAIDAILNQKGRDVICIYVAIGQKASTVKNVEVTLKKYGAMDYSIIVAATASQSSSLQYISPYAATAMAEYFMYSGRDVLIVYDDLSKQASAYREMSLLLKRPPGREAYPGDVFYTHSRLLERAAQLSDEKGGGSITALPIIETQAGDISAYIPTNVISITDGQIFLEDELFHSGVRPAINAGLSVSRVGGSAQLKAMKQVSSTLRIDLASYRELEAFAQFGAELDDNTKKRLHQGQSTVELLKQPAHRPMNEHLQIIILYALTHHMLVDIDVNQLQSFESFLADRLMTSDTALKDWTDDIENKDYDDLDAWLTQLVDEFIQYNQEGD